MIEIELALTLIREYGLMSIPFIIIITLATSQTIRDYVTGHLAVATGNDLDRIARLESGFLSLMEADQRGVMVLNEKGDCIWVSQRLAMEICKAQKKSFYGRRWLSLVVPADRERTKRVLEEAITGNSDILKEEFSVRPNGNEVVLIMNAYSTSGDPFDPEVDKLKATGWIIYITRKDAPIMTNQLLWVEMDRKTDKVLGHMDEIKEALVAEVQEITGRLARRMDDRDQASAAQKVTREAVDKLVAGNPTLGRIEWSD